ncbi:MAG: PorT family protein [Chlorobi bacterium]|nr:PorT family protein [Chlorobiota bacterium]
MKDSLNYIDKFYRDKLEGYTEEPEADAWGKMKWRIFWLRYKWVFAFGAGLFLLTFMFIAFNASYDTTENTGLADNYLGKPELLIASGAGPNTSVNSKETASQATANNNETRLGNEIVKSSAKSPGGSAISEMAQKAYSAGQAPIEESIVQKNVVSEESSLINGLSSNDINYRLSVLPDSLLMGSNRRTDILPPGLKNTWFSVNFYAGPAYCISSLSGNDNEYINLRNDNETNSPAFSLGGDLRFHYKNILITTGLGYSVYNQKRHYKKSYQEYSPEDSYYKYDTTWVWVYDPPDFGKPVISGIDSTWTDVYKTIVIDNSGTNRLEYLEIPLTLGYRFDKNLFSVEVNAGGSVGFFVYSNFRAPSFSDYEDIGDAGQINKAMFNIIANASVYYRLNNKTSIFVSPYYKGNLNSIFQDTYPVNQKFKTFGLNFGVDFRF